MKKLSLSLLFGFAIMAMSSCSDSGSNGSSDGMFGNIPQTLEKYDQEKKELSADMNEGQMAKIEELKTETMAELEKEGAALNGKELTVSVEENVLKIETPLTLVYKAVFNNVNAVEFALDGKIVAVNDIKLEINASDLKGRELLGGKTTVVTAKLPVHVEFLDGEGNVVDTRTIGNFVADNNGEEAIVKAGSAVDLSICSLPVTAKFVNVASARVVIDPTQGLTTETLPE